MKFVEIVEKKDALMKVLDMTLPRKASVAITRNLENINKEINFYYDQRKDIADHYALKDETGNFVLTGKNYTFATDSDREGFIQEIKDLNDTDIDINIIKFHSSELDKCDEDETRRYNILTPAQEISLSWMIDYDD